jgi:hypothetical protein
MFVCKECESDPLSHSHTSAIRWSATQNFGSYGTHTKTKVLILCVLCN